MKPARRVFLLALLLGASLFAISITFTRVGAAYTIAATPLTLAQQQKQQTACDELQIVFIIDQSGSMFGFTNDDGDFVPATDPTGLRFFAPEEAVDLLGSLRWQAYPDATIKVALIHFGDQPRTAMPWQEINPSDQSDYEQLLADLAPYFDPLDNSLGNTLVLGPMQAASSLFSQVPPPTDGCPTRLVVLVTDGLPADGTSGFSWESHLQEVADYARRFISAPEHRIYVVGVDEKGAFFEEAEDAWANVTGDPDRVLRARSQAEMSSLLTRIINEAAGTLVGRGTVQGCIEDGGRIVVPPYLQQLRVTLFYKPPNSDLHLDLQDAAGRTLTDALPDVTVQGFDEPIESVIVSNPQPGIWRVLTELPPDSAAQCLVNFVGITAREQVSAPQRRDAIVQFQEALVAFQLVDNNGNPLPDYNNPDYDLQMDVKLLYASGEEQILTLGANPGQEYRGELIPEHSGGASLWVKATSRDDNGQEIPLLEKSLVDFQVQPVNFVMLDGPDVGSSIGQHTEIPLTFGLVVTGQQTVELALPTTVSATISHEGNNERTNLSLAHNGGAYQATHRLEEAGAYRLVYEAAVNTPEGMLTIGQSEISFNAFPVTLMRANFASPFNNVATDPLLRPTGIELNVQLIDETGQLTSPSAVGVADPDRVFKVTVRNEGGETVLHGTDLMLRTGQPGLYRLRDNDLGAGSYTIFVEPATDLGRGYDWQETSWTVEVKGRINPLFHSLLAITILLIVAAVLGVMSQIRIRLHPLSGAIQIYEEEADLNGLEGGGIKKTLFSKILPRKNRVTYRPNIPTGACQNITRIKVTSPSEQTAEIGSATVVVHYKGKSPSTVTLSPGTPVSIGPGCYMVKDPHLGTAFDSDVALEDEF